MHHNYTGEKLEKRLNLFFFNIKKACIYKKLNQLMLMILQNFLWGATIDFANLSQDKKTLGLTYFLRWCNRGLE